MPTGSDHRQLDCGLESGREIDEGARLVIMARPVHAALSGDRGDGMPHVEVVDEALRLKHLRQFDVVGELQAELGKIVDTILMPTIRSVPISSRRICSASRRKRMRSWSVWPPYLSSRRLPFGWKFGGEVVHPHGKLDAVIARHHADALRRRRTP